MYNFFTSSAKKRTLSVEMNRGIFILLFLISIIFLFLASFSVSYHNRNATNGYKINQLEQKREHLMTQIENLEMRIAHKSTLANLENSEQEKEEFQVKPRIIYLQ